MQNKKKLGMLILIGIFMLSSTQLCYAGIGQITLKPNAVVRKKDEAGNMYAFYKDPAITVITPISFSYHFVTEGATAKTIASTYDCHSVFNGTYFGYGDKNTFFPAGVWYKFGRYLKAPYQPAKDKNLQVLLSGSNTTIDFLDNDSFDFLGGVLRDTRYANAGPRLVRDGRINQSIVKNASHWQRKTTRSGILKNPDGSVSFIISTQDVSLPQFVVFAYASGIGTGSFQFINIDGGSSTSLLTPYSSYKSQKRLPSFICIY